MKSLNHTRKIPAGTEIRLYRKGFGYARVTVIDTTDYYFAGVVDEEFFRSVSDGEEMEAYLWVEDIASYEFCVQVIGRISIGPPVLFFAHTSRIARSTERKCLTAATDIPLTFFTFNPEKDSRTVSSEEVVSQKGRIILLTDREAAIKTESSIQGRFIKGRMTVFNEEIEIIGRLEDINPDKNVYNVLFVGMNDKTRMKILDYVFSVYRE